jgi:L,D-transpeptidase ErfK/SrfK
MSGSVGVAAVAAVPLARRHLLGLLLSAAATPAWAAVAPPAAGGFGRDEVIGEVSRHLTDGERTLLEIARERSLGVPEISAANPGVDPWVPGKETLLTLPTQHVLPDAPREGIVINKAELRLYFFPKLGPVQTYAIGVGREGLNTPVGRTTIVRKAVRPTWRPTPETRVARPELPAVVPPGPDNPLGEYALYLGWPTYAVHGTHKPYGVGRRVSRGCIRMYPEGVAQLYPQVPVGTRVTVVDQPVKVGWRSGELYLEVQPDLAQIDELEATYAMTPMPAPDARPLILAKAGPEAVRVDWDLVDARLVSRSGVPVQITRPSEQLLADGWTDGFGSSTATALEQPASSGAAATPAGFGAAGVRELPPATHGIY